MSPVGRSCCWQHMSECGMRLLKAALIVCASTALADHEIEGRDIAARQVLYADNCASCHGAQLEGQPNWQRAGDDGLLPAPPRDAKAHTWHHDNALLFNYTKLGGIGALAQMVIDHFNSGMPAFESVMSDGDIWDILAYIRSTRPERQQAAQADRRINEAPNALLFRQISKPKS